MSDHAQPRLRRWLSPFRRFATATKAAAAVEFAMILPVGLLLYLGAAVVTDAVATSRKVNLITRTIVDLASKQSTSMQLLSIPAPANAVTQTMLQQIMDGATVLIDPAPRTPLTLTLTAVDVVNLPAGICCAAKVRWSYTSKGTLRPCSSLLSSVDPSQIARLDGFSSSLLPVGLPLVAPLNFLIADVGYAYQPLIQTSLLPFSPVMARTQYMMPRSPGQVIATGLTAPSGSVGGGIVCY